MHDSYRYIKAPTQKNIFSKNERNKHASLVSIYTPAQCYHSYQQSRFENEDPVHSKLTSQNGRGWQDLWVHLFQPCSSRDTESSVPKATTWWVLDISNLGDSVVFSWLFFLMLHLLCAFCLFAWWFVCLFIYGFYSFTESMPHFLSWRKLFQWRTAVWICYFRVLSTIQ